MTLNIDIEGPFWHAEADVLRLADPERAWALRELFVDLGSRNITRQQVLLPGTMLVLVFARSVRISPAASSNPNYLFVRPNNDDPPADNIGISQIRDLLLAGKISLLLVQADPAQWDDVDVDRPGSVRCLAGHISLDVLAPERSTTKSGLYGALDLELPPSPLPDRPGAALVPSLSVHGSGVTLVGKGRLPWQTERVMAPFQLARIVPDPRPDGGAAQRGYRLTLETERMLPAERAAVVAAWGRLAASLDPANPAGAAGALVSAPRWATLSVANPGAIPRMYWLAQPWNAGAPHALPLHIERDELVLVLADQSPYDRDRPATALARTILDDVTISRTAQGAATEIRVQIRAARPGATAPLAGSLAYDATPIAGGWDERYTLSGAETAFDPVEVPRAVRAALGQPAPVWAPGAGAIPVEPPVVWAFSPLEDGWAQLPIPNLTDQMYLDAQLARDPQPIQPLLAGAVAYGNDAPGVLAGLPAEHAWSLTLLDADAIDGTWTMRQASASAPLVLTRVALALAGPEVSVNGLVWLATGRPTSEDALPTLDDWIAGLRPIALHTVDPAVDVLPPLAKTTIASLAFSLRTSTAVPSAELAAWSMALTVDAARFRTMVDAHLVPADAFARDLPLVWRRHRTLPMVQALPMTQSRSPAAFPSASRQLAPFELPVAVDAGTGLSVPSGWTFGRAGSGAQAWPRATGAAAPARAWTARADLPLAALSLPGLVLDPKAAGRTGLPADPATALPQQWRHDLPYTDEAHALAQLPRTSPDAASAVPAPPLERATLAAHWQALSERASLAAADAVAATVSASGQTQIAGVIEPLVWPVSASVAIGAYPGTLSLVDAAGGPRLDLTGADALAGIAGDFTDGSASGTVRRVAASTGSYPVTAGAMAAVHASDGAYRDQRGLLRGATVASARLLRTPVRLTDASSPPYELTTLRDAVSLRVGPGAAAPTWRLWFRDLPVSAGMFSRAATRSTRAEDINDPEATARAFDHLNGFEWRLAPAPSGAYTLFGLGFFPLTLEAVAVAGDDVTRVDLVGRLQLPTAAPTGPAGDTAERSELTDLANAVRLTFEVRSGALTLTAVRAESTLGDWPLALAAGEAGDAPRIEWTQIALTGSGAGVTVTAATLAFQLFGAAWRLPLAPFTFTAAAAPVTMRLAATNAAAAEPMPPREVALTLDPAGGAHGLTVAIGLRIGRGVSAMPAGARTTPLTWVTGGQPPELVPAGSRTAFAAEVRFDVVSGGPPSWTRGLVFGDVDLARVDPAGAPSLVAGDRALEFCWRAYTVANPRLQLLPGMHLDTDAGTESPGFATAAFRVITAANDVPTLHLASSFVEALVPCRWGEFLQDVQSSAGAPSPRRVFGSSAGDLIFGFTGQSRETTWDEQYLLNGFLEIKNLVSWPRNAAFDAARVKLTLPAAKPATALDHLRHTIRVLFDQHTIPPGTLDTGPADLLFQLAAGKGWQFLAAVEHQLVDVAFAAASGALGVAVDRRWVAVQEVRLVTPAQVKAWLLDLRNDGVRLQVPTDADELDVEPLGDASAGVLASGLRARLAEGAQPALDALATGTLLVEASAVHWVKELPITAPVATALQYLPGGTQLAALSRPEDYGPADPRDPAWLLLQMPFLGRLHDRARDAVDPPAGGAAPPLLAIDPVLNLQRRRSDAAALPPLVLALSAWGDTAAVNATFAAFDAAVGKSFARLDPIALEESWFAVQRAAPEAVSAALPSVVASRPDTPARLGRPAALARVYGGSHTSYPPQGEPGDAAPDSTSAPPVWRPNALLVYQAVSSVTPGSAPPYGWLATLLALVTGLVPRTAGQTGLRRFVAATEVPFALSSAPVPTSVAVSPYLSLELAPASGASALRLRVAELLCLDTAAGGLRPVATHAFEPSADASEADLTAAADAWARATQVRLAPESPIAVLRLRDVRQPITAAAGAVLVTRYSFALVAPAPVSGALARRVFRLRSRAAELRFRDGRFGGPELPVAPRPFELAPPQVIGVEPFHLFERPAAQPDTPPDVPAPAAPVWPWGFSGLRTTVQYTAGGAGVVGPAPGSPDATRWWQSLRHAVVYRTGLGSDPAAGLPPTFRAPAIASLLPVLPGAPLPTIAPEAGQSVLPGASRATLVGSRPGVFLAMRHHIVSQRGRALVSGSVPVRHRAPRPIPLPPNDAGREATALQTWASAFEPGVALRVRSAPDDEVYLAASDRGPAHRLRMQVVAPASGEIDASWDGTLIADLAFEPAAEGQSPPVFADWRVDLALRARGRLVRYQAGVADGGGGGGGDGRFAFRVQPADSAELRALLATLAPGDSVAVQASIGRADPRDDAGLRQVLSFPVRFVDPGAARLPLRPVFVRFEDPEYNRLLASATKRATSLISIQGASGPELSQVTLAADRTAYDPQSPLALRYDWTGAVAGAVPRLSLDLLDATGVPRPLAFDLGAGPGTALELATGQLVQLSLLALFDRGQRITLSAGQSLRLVLAFAQGQGILAPAVVQLTVDIVDAPAIPAPEAAYALLRWQTIDGATQVDCARFAWGPPATRVELVSPDDLRHEIVRRRAVFRWTDTARAGTVTGYAIQKITRTGSTHVPGPTPIDG